MTPAIECGGVGKRYGRQWAIEGCDLAVPRGRVVGLIGPNGAGKTTLLEILAGLRSHTTGDVRIFGVPTRLRAGTLPRIGFLAQDRPLYRSFRVLDLLRFGASLNPAWDEAYALRRLADLGIPLDARTGSLSGGQQAQVALTLTLAKRPDLLLLDEPLANLDPVARRDLMRALLDAATEAALTVVISSHVVAELEGACDYLVILQRGRVQVSGDIDDLLSRHTAVVGPSAAAAELDPARVIHVEHVGGVARVAMSGPDPILDPRWTPSPLRLEELILAYLQSPDASALPGPERAVA